MSTKQFAALLGFAFVAAWTGFGFGYAVLCLAGAVSFYLAAGVREGEIDLAELQSRLGGAASPVANPAPPPGRSVRPSPRRARVQ